MPSTVAKTTSVGDTAIGIGGSLAFLVLYGRRRIAVGLFLPDARSMGALAPAGLWRAGGARADRRDDHEWPPHGCSTNGAVTRAFVAQQAASR